MKRNYLVLLTIIAMSFSVQAKRFASQYCEFELPAGWKCNLEGSEWVCQSSNKDRQKEAIIILAAKIRGSQDSLDGYQTYLKRKKTFTLPGGKTQVSDPRTVGLKTINTHRWVDALHLASEVPGFYTRYLATVKEDLGVAVTFSVAKDFYNQYRGIFDKVIATLRVFRQKNGPRSTYKMKEAKDLAGGEINFLPDDEQLGIGHQRKSGKSGSGTDATTYLMYALLAGATAFGLKKLKKTKGGKKKKTKKKKVKKVKKD